MLTSTIYNKYKIPPHLQLHMIRVASVAAIVCDNIEASIDKKSVITACLLHDMGNIIKFDLSLYPNLLEPEGYDYWKSIQEDFIDKYGNEEHVATEQIAHEVGVDEGVVNLISSIGFSKAQSIGNSDDLNLKIVAYADQRVGINGILSMSERHAEGRERYKNRVKFAQKSIDEFNRLSGFFDEIEKQIFENCKIRPEDITDLSVNKYLVILPKFSVLTVF